MLSGQVPWSPSKVDSTVRARRAASLDEARNCPYCKQAIPSSRNPWLRFGKRYPPHKRSRPTIQALFPVSTPSLPGRLHTRGKETATWSPYILGGSSPLRERSVDNHTSKVRPETRHLFPFVHVRARALRIAVIPSTSTYSTAAVYVECGYIQVQSPRLFESTYGVHSFRCLTAGRWTLSPSRWPGAPWV